MISKHGQDRYTLVGGVNIYLVEIQNLVGYRLLPAGHHSVACDFCDPDRHLELMIANVMENSIFCLCSLLMAVTAWFLRGSKNFKVAVNIARILGLPKNWVPDPKLQWFIMVYSQCPIVEHGSFTNDDLPHVKWWFSSSQSVEFPEGVSWSLYPSFWTQQTQISEENVAWLVLSGQWPIRPVTWRGVVFQSWSTRYGEIIGKDLYRVCFDFWKHVCLSTVILSTYLFVYLANPIYLIESI